jgi:hypothetical protein
LGRIGVGYIYADWIPQIIYITPSFDGFQVSGGIFQPLNTFDFTSAASASAHSLPMFQAKATYDFNVNDDIKGGRVWVSGLAQRSIANSALDTGAPQATNVGVTQYVGDVGIKANVFGFEPVIYYYQGRGVGTTAIGFGGIDATGAARNSRGGYFQVGRSFGKWRPSFSYGLSQLHTGSGESNATNPALVHTNRSRVQMLQYQLTKSLTLVEEFTTTHSRAQLNIPGTSGTNMQYNISLGAILFF